MAKQNSAAKPANTASIIQRRPPSSSVSARVVLSGAFQDRFAQHLLQGLCRFRAGACASRELVEDSGAASCTEQYVPCGD